MISGPIPATSPIVNNSRGRAVIVFRSYWQLRVRPLLAFYGNLANSAHCGKVRLPLIAEQPTWCNRRWDPSLQRLAISRQAEHQPF
jgi:hypothetical protein